MKPIISFAAMLLSLALLFTGCANTAIQASDLTAAVTAPDVTDKIADDLSPVGTLGLELLESAIAAEDKNPVISPLSAYICLAMVMNGTAGDTLAAFEQVMGADTQYANLICRTAASILAGLKEDTALSLACSAWVDDAAMITEEYLQAIAANMGSEVFQADLSSAQAIKDINSWVNGKTNGLIPSLREEPYPDITMLVLLNALYMDAKWERPFMGYSTFESTFTDADGNETPTDFMSMTGDTQYIHTDGAYGVLLPYTDGRLAFAALLPEDGDIAGLASSLTQEKLHKAVLNPQLEYAFLKLPKFDFSYDRLMTDDLSALGLAEAFDPDRADLTPMGSSQSGKLYLSSVFQKVRIQVNEEGTKAAAVTEAAVVSGAAIIDPLELSFDRPFLYAVLDTQTGLPLFLGVYHMPAE